MANVRFWQAADNPTAPAFVHYWSHSGHRATAFTSLWVRAKASNLRTRLVRYRIDSKRVDVILLKFLVGAAGFEPTTPSPPDWCANRAAPRPDRNDADYRTVRVR